MDIRFTICFIRHNHRYLMLYRNHPPNQYLWNGVGGKIEPGELPREACIREIEEETSLQIATVSFRGIVTWNQMGGMYVFVADSDTDRVIASEEGKLAWKTLDWVLQSEQVVSNISIFLPPMLREDYQLAEYQFMFTDDGRMRSYDIKPINPKHIRGKFELEHGVPR